MDQRLQAVEAELRRLGEELARVQARVVALETGRRPADAQKAAPGIDGPVMGVAGFARPRLQTVASALGLAFIGLGGAYLLRAVTDAGLLTPVLGVSAGLVYAAVWIGIATRSAKRATTIDAGLHGLVAVLVAFPLIFEATLRFAIVPPDLAALALAALSALYLGVAWRARLHVLAWLTVVAALVTGLVLMARTGVVLPYATAFVAIGVVTLWISYDRKWAMLRWPAAVVADVVVAGLLLRVAVEPPLDPVGRVLAVQLLLLSGYLGSIAVRTLVLGRNVIPFEVVQTVAVLIVGLGGAMSLARASTWGAAIGWGTLLLALAAYGVAFAFLDRRHGRGVNFYFYSSLALVCALAGSGVLLPPVPRAVVWSALAVATTVAAGRFGRLALAYHGAVYLLGAALAGRLLYHAVARMTGLPVADGVLWPELVVLAAAAVMCDLPAAAEPGLSPRWESVHRFTSAFVLLFCGIGVTAMLGAMAIEAAGVFPVPPGVSATVRTTALAAGAVVAGWLALWPRLSIFGVFVYPILALTGVKLLVEDLRVSEPATLFVALATFGLALVVAARFARNT